VAELKDLTGLTTLNLHRTEVTDACLEHLKSMRSLRYLALGGTQVTTAGMEALQRELPQCTIAHE
jgi:hypothetical protein